MTLNTAQQRFLKVFRKVPTGSFKGQIYSPSDYMPLDNFASPRRMMRTLPGANVKAKDIFLDSSGRRFLVALHTNSDHDNLQYETFRVFDIDRTLSWARPTSSVDSVTLIPKESGSTDLGTIYCALEPRSPVEDRTNVPASRYRIITGSALAPGDLIGAVYTVERVDIQLGVYIAEVMA